MSDVLQQIGITFGWLSLLQFGGTALTSAVEGSIVTMATPVFVLVFGRLIEGVAVPRQAVGGIGLAAAGADFDEPPPPAGLAAFSAPLSGAAPFSACPAPGFS